MSDASEPSAPPREHASADAGAANGLPEELDEGTLLQALPGLLRIAGAAWWRTTEWTVATSVRAGSRLLRAAVAGEPPAELFRATGEELRSYVRRVLEIVESPGGDGALRPEGPAARRDTTSASDPAQNGRDQTTASLRERGAELLRRSADVRFEEDAHPAYARILAELAPDEGRILRLLALEGPQASVDVRTGGPLGVINSELVAPGLTMIGAEAGCRYLDRVPAYLNNVYRLGLIWFSREPLKDTLRYQVLEAQPDVATAMREAGRGRTVRRSIHLTPFGEDFCETCLPLHTAELEALPGGPDTPPPPSDETPAGAADESVHEAPDDGAPRL